MRRHVRRQSMQMVAKDNTWKDHKNSTKFDREHRYVIIYAAANMNEFDKLELIRKEAIRDVIKMIIPLSGCCFSVWLAYARMQMSLLCIST